MIMTSSDPNVETWKLKRLIQNLDIAHGAGTSMISLVLPAKSQLSRTTNMLNQEFGMASNIKSHVNKLSVQSAITSALTRLRAYNNVPPNGLAVYVGTIASENGKTKKIAFDFQPPKPFTKFVYFCGTRFDTVELKKLLDADDSRFGFIIIDGSGALFGSLHGSTRETLQQIKVDLPKKHSRGGQSALRFSRLRDEARHNYVRKVTELAVQHFIDASGEKANVAGLILAGSGEFKTELAQGGLLDARLSAKIIRIVDVAYGGMNGFNQAIDLAADSLSGLRFIQEKHLVQSLFDEISRDSAGQLPRYCIGLEDTIRALEMGAVEKLLAWDNLDVVRRPREDGSVELARGVPVGRVGLEEEEQSLLEWLAENYRSFGATLEFVSDKTPEGAQFARGFGGVAALLRYGVDPVLLSGEDATQDDEFYSSDDERVT